MMPATRGGWDPCRKGEWEQLGALLAARRRMKWVLGASVALVTSAAVAAGAWGVASALDSGQSGNAAGGACGQPVCEPVPPCDPTVDGQTPP
jgi:hypothetical protein